VKYLLVAAALLAFAASAFADSKMGQAGDAITFRSEDAGISNELTVSLDKQGRIRFADDTDPYGMSGYPSPPCSPGNVNGQGNAIEVFCDKGAVKGIQIDIGPGQDDVAYRLRDVPGTLSGNLGADFITSSAAADTLNGGQGNDTLESGSGGDTVNGDDGADSIHAGDGADKVDGGLGSDGIDAGAGNDSLTVADGIADSVECGPGDDTVDADQLDQLANCERVSRHDVAPPSDQPPADDHDPPTLTAHAQGKQKISMKRRSVTVAVSASEKSAINVSGYLDAGGVNRRLKVPPAVNLGEGGTRVGVKLSKGQASVALRDIRRGKRPRVKLTISAVDPAGNTSKPRHLVVRLRG
jgi:RTX calcium-binding nonapeptide repeat (4 copies)